MTKTVRPLVAGNWKMNGLIASLDELRAMAMGVKSKMSDRVDLVVCPPATLLTLAADICRDTPIALGAQDCHALASGAHTGDFSAEMIKDCGATFVILGHSERRADHGETDALVREKARAALRAGLTPIVCVGETELQRKAGETLAVVAGQLQGSLLDEAGAATIVAYEPVWAIGTGLTPTLADVAEVHADIRKHLANRYGAKGEAMRILYGGSVKPANAAELMGVANVDGALVGGASLKAADFLAIAATCCS